MPYVTFNAQLGFMSMLSKRAPWSTLTRLGRLPIIRASVFAPFVGYIILFNDHVVAFFNEISINIGLNSGLLIHDGIYYTYFGLILIGFAQILYTLLCPGNVSQYGDAIRYSDAIRDSNKTLIADNLDNVLSAFIRNERISEEKEQMDYPERVRLLTSDLIERIYNSTDKNQWDEELETENENDISPDMLMFTSGSGYLIAENIAVTMHERPRAMAYYAEPLRDSATEQFGYDISHLDFQVDDYRHPRIRVTCAALYLLGAMLLFIPATSAMLTIITGLI